MPPRTLPLCPSNAVVCHSHYYISCYFFFYVCTACPCCFFILFFRLFYLRIFTQINDRVFLRFFFYVPQISRDVMDDTPLVRMNVVILFISAQLQLAVATADFGLRKGTYCTLFYFDGFFPSDTNSGSRNFSPFLPCMGSCRHGSKFCYIRRVVFVFLLRRKLRVSRLILWQFHSILMSINLILLLYCFYYFFSSCAN